MWFGFSKQILPLKKFGNKEHASAHFSTQEITILPPLNSSRTHNTNFPPSLAPLLQQRPSGSCSIRYIINLVCSFSSAPFSKILPYHFATISGHFPSPTCHLPLRSTCPSMNLQSVTGVSTNPMRSGNSLSTNGGSQNVPGVQFPARGRQNREACVCSCHGNP